MNNRSLLSSSFFSFSRTCVPVVVLLLFVIMGREIITTTFVLATTSLPPTTDPNPSTTVPTSFEVIGSAALPLNLSAGARATPNSVVGDDNSGEWLYVGVGVKEQTEIGSICKVRRWDLKVEVCRTVYAGPVFSLQFDNKNNSLFALVGGATSPKMVRFNASSSGDFLQTDSVSLSNYSKTTSFTKAYYSASSFDSPTTGAKRGYIFISCVASSTSTPVILLFDKSENKVIDSASFDSYKGNYEARGIAVSRDNKYVFLVLSRTTSGYVPVVARINASYPAIARRILEWNATGPCGSSVPVNGLALDDDSGVGFITVHLGACGILKFSMSSMTELSSPIEINTAGPNWDISLAFGHVIFTQLGGKLVAVRISDGETTYIASSATTCNFPDNYQFFLFAGGRELFLPCSAATFSRSPLLLSVYLPWSASPSQTTTTLSPTTSWGNHSASPPPSTTATVLASSTSIVSTSSSSSTSSSTSISTASPAAGTSSTTSSPPSTSSYPPAQSTDPPAQTTATTTTTTTTTPTPAPTPAPTPVPGGQTAATTTTTTTTTTSTTTITPAPTLASTTSTTSTVLASSTSIVSTSSSTSPSSSTSISTASPAGTSSTTSSPPSTSPTPTSTSYNNNHKNNNNNDTNNKNSPSSNATATIAGAVGGSLGFLLLIFIIFLLYRRNSKKNQQQPQQQSSSSSSASTHQQPFLDKSREADDEMSSNPGETRVSINDLEEDAFDLDAPLSSVQFHVKNNTKKFSLNNNSSGVQGKKRSSSSSSGVMSSNANELFSDKEEEEEEDDETNLLNSTGVTSPTSASSGGGDRSIRFGTGLDNESSSSASSQENFAKSFDVLPANYKPAHSAEDSCRNVLALLNNPTMTQNEIDAAVSQVKRKAKDLIPLAAQYNLTKNELDALVFYTSDVRRTATRLNVDNNVWHFLNKSLGQRASQHFSVHSPLLDFLAYLTSGVKKLPAASGVILWRAVPQPLSELSKKQGYSTGTTICFPGFTSVSRDSSFVISFAGTKHGSIMSIISSAAYSIKEFSMFPHEEEMLLLPNSFVQVSETKLDVDYQSDVTVKSLGTVPLPKKLDIVHLAQLDEESVQQQINFQGGGSQKHKKMKKPVEDLDEDELSLLLQSKKISDNIISCLKTLGINGQLFCEDNFVEETLDEEVVKKFHIVPLALKQLKKLHKEVTTKVTTSATAASSSS